MSLINQVLRDLDQRRAPTLDDSDALPAAVHAIGRLQPAHPRYLAWLLALGVIAIALAALVQLTVWHPDETLSTDAGPRLVQDTVAPVTPPPSVPAAPASPANPTTPTVTASAAPVPLAPSVPIKAVEAPAAKATKTENSASPPTNIAPPPQKSVVPVPAAPAASAPALTPAPTKPPLPSASASSTRPQTDTPPLRMSGGNEQGSPVAKTASPPLAAITPPPASASPPPPSVTPPLSFQEAMALAQAGKNGEAITALQALLRQNKNHAQARQALISLLTAEKRTDDAASLIKEGLGTNPNQPALVKTLARLYLDSGKVSDAARTMTDYAKYAGNDSDYIAFHALLLHKQNRTAEAIERYRTVAQMRPNDARIWYGLGLALTAEKNTEEAKAAFRKAKELGTLPPDLAASIDRHLN